MAEERDDMVDLLADLTEQRERTRKQGKKKPGGHRSPWGARNQRKDPKAEQVATAAAWSLLMGCLVLFLDKENFRFMEAGIVALGMFGVCMAIVTIMHEKRITFESLVYDVAVWIGRKVWALLNKRVGGPSVVTPERSVVTQQTPPSGRGAQIGKYADDHELYLGLQHMHHMGVFALSGGGKTTLLHTLIHNVTLNYGPNEVQFAISDLKEVSFRIFERSPWLMFPIAREAETPRLLESLNNELQRRKQAFQALPADRLCEDLNDYRRLKKELGIDLPDLPYLLIIIDEVQELAPFKGSMDVITRIAKQGRAFGMKLILCTQRPTTVGLSHEIQAQLNRRMVGSMTTNKEYGVAQVPKEVYELKAWTDGSGAGRFLVLVDDKWRVAQIFRTPRERLETTAARFGKILEEHPELQVSWPKTAVPTIEDEVFEVQATIDDEDMRTKLTGSPAEKTEQVVQWLRDGGYNDKPSIREFQETFIAAQHTARKHLSNAWAIYERGL